MRQFKLSLFRLFGQDMALKGVLSLDLSRTGKLESLLGTGFCLHLGHLFLVKLIVHFLAHYFFAFGAMNIVIRFPSSLGICSTFPKSSRSVARRSNKISPLSLYTIDLPLKNT